MVESDSVERIKYLWKRSNLRKYEKIHNKKRYCEKESSLEKFIEDM